MSSLEPIAICQHCNRWIFDREDFITIERHSGPSPHQLYFHKDCWKCPKCGTNGPHYCPSDVAKRNDTTKQLSLLTTTMTTKKSFQILVRAAPIRRLLTRPHKMRNFMPPAVAFWFSFI